MRISDHRYSRDLRKYNLAMRLIHHEARTGTIRDWTGLSRRCIRNLFRSYVHDQVGGGAARHRGPSPYNVEFLLQSSEVRSDIAVLASICCLSDLIPAHPPQNTRREPPNVLRAELLCSAFEMFRELVPLSTITLEHALLMVATLIQGKELALRTCVNCTALIVIDFHADTRPICDICISAGYRNRSKKATPRWRNRTGALRRAPQAPPEEPCQLTTGQNSNDSVIEHQDRRTAERYS
jgi:hypothetical protein